MMLPNGMRGGTEWASKENGVGQQGWAEPANQRNAMAGRQNQAIRPSPKGNRPIPTPTTTSQGNRGRGDFSPRQNATAL